jgi:hypothetical protein
MKLLSIFVLLIVFSLSLQYSSKIEPEVIANLELKGGKTNVMVELQQIDLNALEKAALDMEWIQKGRFVYEAVKIKSFLKI